LTQTHESPENSERFNGALAVALGTRLRGARFEVAQSLGQC